ncbi:hypothetical protein MU448_04525 [Streptococcus sp. O1]|nr:Rib/alpha-like domain-containing protein [Streptococcus sp. O1]MCQ9213702.1 hypothetical protein [Streptococcus sp. O1]
MTITIVDPRSDADKHDPQGRAQTVNMGDTPAPANSLESVPAGSQVSYKTLLIPVPQATSLQQLS